MGTVVVVASVVVLVALVQAQLTRRRVAAQRLLTSASDQRAAAVQSELAATASALSSAEQQRIDAEDRARAADEATASAEQAAAAARHETAAAEESRERARRDAKQADEARRVAEQRAAAAEQRLAEAVAIDLDPHVLWSLERARSARAWQISVALSPELNSVMTDAQHALIEALQIELDATREESGTVVTLDAELPLEVTAAGSLLTLRVAQELIATVVRRSEKIVLRVHANGADIVVSVAATDRQGMPVSTPALQIPESPAVEQTASGVVVRNAIVAPPPADAAHALEIPSA